MAKEIERRQKKEPPSKYRTPEYFLATQIAAYLLQKELENNGGFFDRAQVLETLSNYFKTINRAIHAGYDFPQQPVGQSIRAIMNRGKYLQMPFLKDVLRALPDEVHSDLTHLPPRDEYGRSIGMLDILDMASAQRLFDDYSAEANTLNSLYPIPSFTSGTNITRP